MDLLILVGQHSLRQAPFPFSKKPYIWFFSWHVGCTFHRDHWSHRGRSPEAEPSPTATGRPQVGFHSVQVSLIHISFIRWTMFGISYHWDSHDCFPVLSTSLIPSLPWWSTVDIALTHKASTAPNAHFSTPFLLLKSYFCFQSLPDPLSSFPSVTQPNTKAVKHLFFPSLGSGPVASYEPQESATFKSTYI